MTALTRLRAPLLVATALVLHTTVLVRLRPAGVAPDLMLLLAVAGGIAGGAVRGGILGFFSGMAIDLFLETPLGLSALVFCLVGYAVGTAQAAILRTAWWIPVVTALVASAAGEVVYALVGTVVGGQGLLTARLALVVGVVSVVNAVLAVLVVPLVGWALADQAGEAPYAP